MCLYPRLTRNPKYKENKKNGGNIPTPKDDRVLYVPIGCGKCEECRKQLANEWRVRMNEELKSNKEKAWYITLTFSEERLKLYEETTEEKEKEYRENTIATKAVRDFDNRWKKKWKKNDKKWLITELGHENTERIHLHGIIWCSKEKAKELETKWKNGWCDIDGDVTPRTINYIIKYITKVDNKHKDFKGKILCSPGIGNNYIKKGGEGHKFNKYRPNETKEYYRTKEGYKLGLPIYYRNHIYTEEEREKLWIEKLDKQETWVKGTKIDISNEKGIENYLNILEKAQKDNTKNGYMKPNKWGSEIYNQDMLKILEKTRNNKIY